MDIELLNEMETRMRGRTIISTVLIGAALGLGFSAGVAAAATTHPDALGRAKASAAQPGDLIWDVASNPQPANLIWDGASNAQPDNNFINF